MVCTFCADSANTAILLRAYRCNASVRPQCHLCSADSNATPSNSRSCCSGHSGCRKCGSCDHSFYRYWNVAYSNEATGICSGLTTNCQRTSSSQPIRIYSDFRSWQRFDALSRSSQSVWGGHCRLHGARECPYSPSRCTCRSHYGDCSGAKRLRSDEYC